MKLSPHWRRAWRRFSFQSLGWSLAGLAAWPNLPADLKAEIPPQVAVWALGLLLALGLIGSVIDQPKTRSHSDETPRP
jgi:hypothetical protein